MGTGTTSSRPQIDEFGRLFIYNALVPSTKTSTDVPQYPTCPGGNFSRRVLSDSKPDPNSVDFNSSLNCSRLNVLAGASRKLDDFKLLQMGQVSCGEPVLLEELLDGGVKFVEAVAERGVVEGLVREPLGQAGAEGAVVEAGAVQAHFPAGVGEVVAVSSALAEDQAVQTQAAKPIGRRAGRLTRRFPTPKSRVSLIVVSVRRARPSW